MGGLLEYMKQMLNFHINWNTTHDFIYFKMSPRTYFVYHISNNLKDKECSLEKIFGEINFNEVFEKYPKTRLVMQIYIVGEGCQVVSYQFEQSPDFLTKISEFISKNVHGLKRVEK